MCAPRASRSPDESQPLSSFHQSSDSFDLIFRAAFGPPHQARQSWIEWTENHFTLDDAPPWAIPLLPAIGANLKGLEPVADTPRLGGLLHRQWYITGLTTSDYESARGHLDSANVPAVLSGAFALRELWPTPASRKLDDATLLVSPERLGDAMTALANAGYVVPACTEPAWHQQVDVVSPTGSTIALTGWILGPKVVDPAREMTWRSHQESEEFQVVDALIASLGSRMLHPARDPHGPQWQTDVRLAIAAGGLRTDHFVERTNDLGLGAVAAELLAFFGQRPPGLHGGEREATAWQVGSKRQHLWHHPRLAAATERRFSPGSYLRYRRHLAQHEHA